MRRFCLLLLAAAAPAGDYAFPGPDRIVVRLSESDLGGNRRPVVEVYANGRVRVKGKLAAARMTKPELQDLLRFAIEKHEFFAYDEAEVNRQLELREPVLDCGTGYRATHVLVAIRGQRREFGVGLLASRAATHKDIEGLVHLHAIARRLHLESKLAQSGGRAKVVGYLKEANLRLKQRYPKLAPFTIEEFDGLVQVPKGEMIVTPGWDPNFPQISGECAQFKRRVPGKIISATVTTDPKAQPRAAAQVQG